MFIAVIQKQNKQALINNKCTDFGLAYLVILDLVVSQCVLNTTEEHKYREEYTAR